MYTVKTNPLNESQVAIETLDYVLYLYTDCASVHFWPTGLMKLNLNCSTVSTDFTTLDDESVGITALVMGY